MPDPFDTITPEPVATPAAEPSESAVTEAPQAAGAKRRHRVLVWSLVVLASVLLTVSITANWVQRELLDTDKVVATTDEILADEDVQEALSIYSVDQLFANVDIQGQLEERLPGGAQALAVPAAAAARQLAVNIEERALASPRVQDLLAGAAGRAHARFVRLIRSEGEYVSTTGGEVTLEYGPAIADLAARLGVDAATISQIQDVVRDFSQDLEQGLTTAQTEIKSVRDGIAQVQGGELSSEQQQNLEALQQKSSELSATVASLDGKIADAQESVPAPLQSRLGELEDRLSDLEARLTAMGEQIDAVLKDPSQANLETLDARLATLEGRVADLLRRPIVQSPGELVLLKSDQLDGVQTIVRALRNLGFVLPLLVLLMYLGALYLAKGWRREALIAVGGGILAATLVVLMARRLIGSAVADSLASSDTVKPAVSSVWEIVSDALRERALFVLVIGLAFIGGGLLAGPGRSGVRVRRFLAPYLRDHRLAVYAVAAVMFLLWLAFTPAINNLGQVLVIVALAVLAVLGIEHLRRQTALEFPRARA